MKTFKVVLSVPVEVRALDEEHAVFVASGVVHADQVIEWEVTEVSELVVSDGAGGFVPAEIDNAWRSDRITM